jgi:hypothetical protein
MHDTSNPNVAYSVASYIYKIFPIVFLVVGTIANILSAIVYSKKKMRKSSYSVYLLTLAIVDLFVTLTGNTRILLMSYDLDIFFPVDMHTANLTADIASIADEFNATTRTLIPFREFQRVHLQHTVSHDAIFHGVDLRETSIYACRIHRFLTYFWLQFSSIILCMLSIDRFFGCVLVLKASRLCKPSIARKIVVCTAFVLAAFNAHFLVGMGRITPVTDPATNKTFEFVQCEPNHALPGYKQFWSAYFYLDSLIYCILPFFIMITCNTLIISKIVSSRIRSKQVIVSRSKKKQNYSLHKSQSSCVQTQAQTSINHTKISTTSANNNNNSSNMIKSEKRISSILIGISVSFVLFTLPVFVMENLSDAMFENPLMEIALALAYMLMYLNHVVNFFFYCSLGPNFRKEVRRLLPRFISNRVSPQRLGRYKTVLLASSSRVPNFHLHRHHRQDDRREPASYLNVTTAKTYLSKNNGVLPIDDVVNLNESVLCSPSEMRPRFEAFKKNSMKKHTVSFTNHTTSTSNSTASTTATTNISSNNSAVNSNNPAVVELNEDEQNEKVEILYMNELNHDEIMCRLNGSDYQVYKTVA